ncbi:MAG: cation:proton antiporter [Armatimonadetes bacterium]|nr:cation:proton antiporter [Armatimonadota bacterium]
MSIEVTGVFLTVAILVAIIANRLKIPYTVGLVLAGAGLAFSPISGETGLTKEMVFTLFLPPLVFEASFLLRWEDFKKDLGVATAMATWGIGLSVAVVAFAMSRYAGWDLAPAIAFAVLISATDPVSVIATMKEAGIKGRLRNLVESESLLNDGTAAVGFGIAVALGMGEHFAPFDAVMDFFAVALGGIAIGGLVAGACLLVAGRTEDHLVELAITTLAAFGSFLLAEHWHLSGVLATVTAGLMLGNLGSFGPITAKGHQAVESFWDFGAFLANSFVFLLIGINEARENLAALSTPIMIAIGAVLVGRAIGVYTVCGGFHWSRARVKSTHQHVLFWGGLRGALALALALGLPRQFPMRAEIITVTAGVVAFSILIQGLSMTPILKRMAAKQEAENQAG